MFQDKPIMNLQQFVNNYLDITSLKDEFQNYVIAILKDEESYDSLQRGLEDIRNEVERLTSIEVQEIT